MSDIDRVPPAEPGEIPPEWVVAVMSTPQRLGFLPTREFWHGAGQAKRFLFRGRRFFLSVAQFIAVLLPVAFVSAVLSEVVFAGTFIGWILPVLNYYFVAAVYGGLIEGTARRGLKQKYPQLALEAKAPLKSLPGTEI